MMPALQEKGRLLAATPRGRILRGIYLEDSSDPARAYVWAFVQPLYVPASTIVLSLGRRLGGPGKTWSVSDSDRLATAVRDEGAPFFGPMSSPESLADWTFLDDRSDPYAAEARAYSLVAAGRAEEGAQALLVLAGSLTGGAPWRMETKQRAERLSDLASSDPVKAQELLREWESETVAALRVEDLS